jgi:tripartite-type tricarboxylate transporter receptor subunit TctC
MRLRCWTGVMVVVAAALALSFLAQAQSYPDRPVRMVIAFPAGGTIDTLGRILAQKLTETWGRTS